MDYFINATSVCGLRCTSRGEVGEAQIHHTGRHKAARIRLFIIVITILFLLLFIFILLKLFDWYFCLAQQLKLLMTMISLNPWMRLLVSWRVLPSESDYHHHLQFFTCYCTVNFSWWPLLTLHLTLTLYFYWFLSSKSLTTKSQLNLCCCAS